MEKLIKIQEELKVPKKNYNKFGGYYYRNAEDILQAAKPLLIKYNTVLTLTDKIIHIEGRYYVEATATLYDIDSKNTIMVKASARETENRKGMDLSQITGATSSYARKYALNGLFLLDDNKDADSTNKHGKENKKIKPTNSNNHSYKSFKPSEEAQKEIKEIMTDTVMKEEINNLRKVYSTLNNKKAVKNYIAEIKQIRKQKKEKGDKDATTSK